MPRKILDESEKIRTKLARNLVPVGGTECDTLFVESIIYFFLDQT